MTTEDKTGKLFTFLKPLVEECLTSGKEYSIFIKFKRHQVFEIAQQIKESSTENEETKIFVFKKSKLL